MLNTSIQLRVEESFRGRVSGFYGLTGGGLREFGGMQAGLVAEWTGAPVAIFAGAVVLALVVYTFLGARLKRIAAAMLVWILILTVGEKRRLWEILLGSALTSALVLTRETMAFVHPILFLHIFWQHGWKTGLYSMLCSAVFFLGGNLFYYPDNLKLWAGRVIPQFMSPFLDPWRLPDSAMGETLGGYEESNLYRMVLYFFLTFRLHFVALVSAVAVWLLWPVRLSKPLNERVRAAIFLSVLFLALFIGHMQASFFGEYCISCILLYIGYCDFIGLMLLVIAAPTLTKEFSAL